MFPKFFIVLIISASGVPKEAFAILPPGYLGFSASSKQDVLWSQINSNAYTQIAQLPTASASEMQQLNLFNHSFLNTAFTFVSDEMPPGRPRLVHPYGAAAKVQLRIFPNTGYTGIFKTGGLGIARLSLASEVRDFYIPAIALKILVDGRPSVNMHALFSLDGQAPNRNFFENMVSNILAQPTLPPVIFGTKEFGPSLAKLPGGPGDRPQDEVNLPQQQTASVESNGQLVSNVVAPFWIGFVPNPRLGWDPRTMDDFRVGIANIPEGTVLYTLVARWQLNSKEIPIGEVITQSRFVASPYVDSTLFFQHATKRWLQSAVNPAANSASLYGK